MQPIIDREASLRPVDLIPPDDEDTQDDRRWRDYCAEATQVRRERILECVLSRLDDEQSPLYTLIDSCLQAPQEPGRARESIVVLAQVGQQLLEVVAAAVDDQTNLRLAAHEARA